MTTPTDNRGQVRMDKSTKEGLDTKQDFQAAQLGVRIGQKGLTMDKLLTGMTILADQHPGELTEILRTLIGDQR